MAGPHVALVVERRVIFVAADVKEFLLIRNGSTPAECAKVAKQARKGRAGYGFEPPIMKEAMRAALLTTSIRADCTEVQADV